MAGSRTRFFILVLLVLLPAFLPGEEELFIQRLTWEKTDHAYRYEVIVEEQTGSGDYAEILRELKTENVIELSLPPGLYRYRIGVYNLLNRPAGISDWIPFRVLPALQPELHSFSQDFISAGTGDPQVAITLRGANLVEGAELHIQPESGGGDIAPTAFLPGGESARLIFTRLAPGPYRVRIRNPGGLEAALTITVAPLPAPSPAAPAAAADGAAAAAVDAGGAVPDRAGDSGGASDLRGVHVSVEYAPMIPLYGYVFTPFDQVFHPAGVSFRVGFTPLMRSWGDLGLELAPSWTMLDSGTTEIHLGTVYVNGLYQWFFADTAALVIRAGAGVNLIYGTEDLNSASIFTWTFSAGGGVFLRWFIPGVHNFLQIPRNALYLEAGAEYGHLFTKDAPAGYVKPVLGFGARF
jgi:hypothetical protein